MLHTTRISSVLTVIACSLAISACDTGPTDENPAGIETHEAAIQDDNKEPPLIRIADCRESCQAKGGSAANCRKSCTSGFGYTCTKPTSTFEYDACVIAKNVFAAGCAAECTLAAALCAPPCKALADHVFNCTGAPACN